MIPYTQSKVVVRKSDGEMVVHGNCYPTAIGCMLNIPPSDVPNIEVLWDVSISYAYQVLYKWLEHKGYRIRQTFGQHSVFHDGSPKIEKTNDAYCLSELSDEKKAELKAQLKDVYYMVSGQSPRGVTHVCIYQNGVMVHDPHPTGEGILTEEYFEVVEPIPVEEKPLPLAI